MCPANGVGYRHIRDVREVRSSMATAPAEVIVDDRLATVLATVPASDGGARTQYRQLLDLLGRAPPGFALPMIAEARLDELEARLGDDERATMIRALAGSLRHPALILRLASQGPAVAAAAVVAGRLDDWQWSALALELPLAARGYLRDRRDLGPRTSAVLERLGIGEIGLPPPPGTASGAEAGPPPAPAQGPDGIAAIVRRIEAFRRTRRSEARQVADGRVGLEADPPLPFADLVGTTTAWPSEIEFGSGPAGRIVAAPAPFAAMLAGVPLGTSQADAVARCDRRTAAAFRGRRPVRAGRIVLSGAAAIAGAWRIDAAPRYARSDGGFLGYAGVLRRPQSDAIGQRDEGPADRLKQLLHELRTPVNAVQGFAELIQQQLFGPTPHQYRSLAASIAADSAAILAGFEEIDRLVRFETGRGDILGGTCDLRIVTERLLRQLGPWLAERDATIDFTGDGPAPIAVAESEAERTVWRLLAHIAGGLASAERVSVAVSTDEAGAVLRVDLPAALAQLDDHDMFAVAPAGAGNGLGLLGGGFALRLARAEAAVQGGSLERAGDSLLIRFPGLTTRATPHSPQSGLPGVRVEEE